MIHSGLMSAAMLASRIVATWQTVNAHRSQRPAKQRNTGIILKSISPWKKEMSLQKTSPKMKSLSNWPMRVNGMQKTPSRRSEMAKLSRNMLVTVLIRVFCRIVRITRTLPVMPSRKMMLPEGKKDKKKNVDMNKTRKRMSRLKESTLIKKKLNTHNEHGDDMWPWVWRMLKKKPRPMVVVFYFVLEREKRRILPAVLKDLNGSTA